jgi:hypothetical protein
MLDFLQLGKLVLEPLKALRRDVIFGSGRKQGDFVLEVRFLLGLLGESFAHGADRK